MCVHYYYYCYYYYRASCALAVYAMAFVSVCLCLCLSVSLVTSWRSIKTAKHRNTQTMPHDSPGTLVFWCQKSWIWRHQNTIRTQFNTTKNCYAVRNWWWRPFLLAAGGLRLIVERPTNNSCYLEIRAEHSSSETVKVRPINFHSLGHVFYIWRCGFCLSLNLDFLWSVWGSLCQLPFLVPGLTLSCRCAHTFHIFCRHVYTICAEYVQSILDLLYCVFFYAVILA